MTKKAFSLLEYIITISIILLITVGVLYAYKSMLGGLFFGNEADLLYSSIKLAREAADNSNEEVRVYFQKGNYRVINAHDVLLYQRVLPARLSLDGPEMLTFTGELTPVKGATINLRSGTKTKKITIDPATGRIKLWK